ncbi:4-alpha-glucanotransferase [Aminithiophilus ramosus]|uniref:4-alpha-glucanotransferase n=2 Tax=Synergistales TaxID=649776 RepID=A0A9Q7EVW6_9BACT|nr:4-alpha-glucanotransferase [Aminithiophilus ramosus]QTX32798.1 4-alpha-glucanotransferase [Aminithiophilus ramosus]QVL36673.1 4-alpha-glucanotransferase [Synergistota bacterium]
MRERRRSGLLLHPTSFPGPWAIGDLGPSARRFVDFLVCSGQTIWQILPLSPTDGALGDSPYSSPSAMAGNTLLLSPDDLFEEGWIKTLPPPSPGRGDSVDYDGARNLESALLDEAFETFVRRGDALPFEAFRRSEAWWLDEHCLFCELKERFDGLPWSQWPIPYRDRHDEALAALSSERERSLSRRAFGQFLLFRQWERLKGYGAERGLSLWGDLPIYPSLDSVDVWSRPDLFLLDGEGHPLALAGVPPDYFSETGQLWGNPLYRWERHEEERFAWWIRRIRRLLALFDRVRIDHFRGILGYWAIPAGAKGAAEGRWEAGPGERLLAALERAFPSMPFVAENLGVITDDVTEAMRRFNLPGMAVLLFAFDSVGANPYAPHNHDRCSVVYTGTHDNNTARGWWEGEATEKERRNLTGYLGLEGDLASGESVATCLVRMALASVARWCVLPLQDLLRAGGEARMNHPGTTTGNWGWRFDSWEKVEGSGPFLADMTALAGRSSRTEG